MNVLDAFKEFFIGGTRSIIFEETHRYIHFSFNSIEALLLKEEKIAFAKSRGITYFRYIGNDEGATTMYWYDYWNRAISYELNFDDLKHNIDTLMDTLMVEML